MNLTKWTWRNDSWRNELDKMNLTKWFLTKWPYTVGSQQKWSFCRGRMIVAPRRSVLEVYFWLHLSCNLYIFKICKLQERCSQKSASNTLLRGATRILPLQNDHFCCEPTPCKQPPPPPLGSPWSTTGCLHGVGSTEYQLVKNHFVKFISSRNRFVKFISSRNHFVKKSFRQEILKPFPALKPKGKFLLSNLKSILALEPKVNPCSQT